MLIKHVLDMWDVIALYLKTNTIFPKELASIVADYIPKGYLFFYFRRRLNICTFLRLWIYEYDELPKRFVFFCLNHIKVYINCFGILGFKYKNLEYSAHDQAVQSRTADVMGGAISKFPLKMIDEVVTFKIKINECAPVVVLGVVDHANAFGCNAIGVSWGMFVRLLQCPVDVSVCFKIFFFLWFRWKNSIIIGPSYHDLWKYAAHWIMGNHEIRF